LSPFLQLQDNSTFEIGVVQLLDVKENYRRKCVVETAGIDGVRVKGYEMNECLMEVIEVTIVF